MKRNQLIVILTILISALNTSCNEPIAADYSKITGVVYNADVYGSQIDSVYAKVYFDSIDTQNYSFMTSVTIAKAKFQNGGFALQLPALSYGKLCFRIDKAFPDSLVSDKSVKFNYLDLYCIKDGYRTGFLIYQNNYNLTDSGSVHCDYIYCDKPVTVTGTTIEYSSSPIIFNLTCKITTEYKLSFVKGWNIWTKKKRSNDFETRYYQSSNNIPDNMKWHLIN
jgi:hypothetical protein